MCRTWSEQLPAPCATEGVPLQPLAARYYKGYDIRKRFANIDKWLSAYEELPHYMASKSDYYTH